MAKNLVKMVETQEELERNLLFEAVREATDQMETMRFQMEEKLSGLSSMADSVGWTDITGLSRDDGPTLNQLKARSKQIRSGMALNPHLSQGLTLRTDRVWADPITYGNVPGLNGVPTGKGTVDVGARLEDPLNVYYAFGTDARAAREAACYSDGVYLLMGDDKTKELCPIPLSELSADLRNPERAWEIWAYRREWMDYQSKPEGETRVEWIFTDLFKSKRDGRDSIVNRDTGEREPVADKTIIDGHVNRVVGWAYGFPDAGAVIEWARLYSEFMKSGKSMSDAMAAIWAQVKKDTASGVPNTAARLANMTGSGNTAVGVGNDLAPLSTAGRSYDFNAGLDLLAIVGAGLGVSVVALSSNPGAAGGSYGAAQVLTLPERLSTQMRRNWHAEFDKRVLRWLGAKKPEASWPPLVDGSELLRLSQSDQIRWNSGLYGKDEAKAMFEHSRGNYGEIKPVPNGVLLPNNEKSLPRRDIDPEGTPSTTVTQSPGQGQSSGIGDNPGGSNDLRNDTLT